MHLSFHLYYSTNNSKQMKLLHSKFNICHRANTSKKGLEKNSRLCIYHQLNNSIKKALSFHLFHWANNFQKLKKIIIVPTYAMEQTIHGKIPCCIQLSTFTKSQTIKKNTQKAFKFCFCCFPTLGLYISISTFAVI